MTFTFYLEHREFHSFAILDPLTDRDCIKSLTGLCRHLADADYGGAARVAKDAPSRQKGITLFTLRLRRIDPHFAELFKTLGQSALPTGHRIIVRWPRWTGGGHVGLTCR
jgi:hypothetical protein